MEKKTTEVWWQGKKVEVALDALRRVVEILKHPEDHTCPDGEDFSVDAALSILERIIEINTVKSKKDSDTILKAYLAAAGLQRFTTDINTGTILSATKPKKNPD